MRHVRILIVLCVVFFCLQTTNAKIIHIPADSSTIQGGIKGAVNGDTILVARGHYYERILYYGKKILVTSNFIFDNDMTTIDSTIIDGDTSVIEVSDWGSVVYFGTASDTSSVINGFTIKNGIGTLTSYYNTRFGGGIYCPYSSSPKITNNKIVENTANMGGGISCYNSDPNIVDNFIADNYGRNGGGIYFRGATKNYVVTNNIIVNNNASMGGGISCSNYSSPTIDSNVIYNNHASLGGGILCVERSSPLIINNDIIKNSAYTDGGGIHCFVYSSPVITSNNITDNSVEIGGGGGICCNWFSSPEIRDNIVNGNSSNNGGGICCYEYSSPNIRDNIITYNFGYKGGGISCYDDCSPSINNNIINSNSSMHYGAGIWFGFNVQPTISNNIISDNINSVGIFCDTLSYPIISHNDFWNNSDGNFTGCPSSIGDTSYGTNFNHISCDGFYNIYRDPMFADTIYYTLLCISPCIDAGDSSFEVPDSGGRKIDIGIYDYPYVIGDANSDREVNISDVVYIANCIFSSGYCPCPLGAGDANCNSHVEVSDVVYLINYLFRGGPEPGCY